MPISIHGNGKPRNFNENDLANWKEISAAYTITAADFGKTIVCKGNSAYTVTFPTVTQSMDNAFIRLVFTPTSSVLITLSGNFDSATTQYYSWGESASFMAAKGISTWCCVESCLFPVVVSAYRNTALSLVSGAATDLVYDTRVRDSGVDTPNSNFFSTSTGKWTPLYAGEYFVYASVGLTTPTAATVLQIQLNLSGTNKNKDIVTTAANDATVSVSGLFKLDGSADYIKAIVTETGTVGGTVTTGTSATVFYGFRVSRWWN